MSSEVSLFEKLGGNYTEVGGLLYPNLVMEQEKENINVGKYGLLWMDYMKENHESRYRHYLRMGQLREKAAEVNEEAYEMLYGIMAAYLAKNTPKDRYSTMENWKLREQAKQIAEEVVFHDIVYKFY